MSSGTDILLTTILNSFIDRQGAGIQSYQKKREMEEEWARKILAQHAGLNFVQRLLVPDQYPTLVRNDLPGAGNYSTHLLSWSTVGKDKKPIVYPEIVWDKKQGLRQLKPREAVDHALKTGEFIPFDSPEDAQRFTVMYKEPLFSRGIFKPRGLLK
jgi:hypothetical protein